MINDSHVRLLILKYVTASLSDMEAMELAVWVSASSGNAEEFRREVEALTHQVGSSLDAAEFWSRFKERNAQEFQGIRKRRLRRRWVYSSLAAIAACFAAVVLILDGKNAVQPKIAEPVSRQVVAEPVEIVPLTSVDTDESSRTVYVAGVGELCRAVLPDGTRIVLNSGSRLSLSRSFNKTVREVELDGEAFFDVAKDSLKLFVIRCGNESYIVRGTSFNINSYSEDGYSVATLHEGALEVRVKSDIINLEPGEEVRVDDNVSSISKHKVNVENSTNWMNTGKLVFEDTPLRQVANRLARKYQVEITVRPEIENILYTGQNDDESIDEMLRLLEITAPLPITVTGTETGKYHISKK